MSSRRYTSRTRARKRAIDTIFEADQRGQMTPGAILELLDERKVVTAAQTPLPEYAIQIIEGVAAHIYQIDDLLEVHTTKRDFDRLPSADRAVLRVGTWEIVWNDDVPAITAIDEAVTITKDISTDESPSVVNGILDAIRKEAAEVQATDDAFQAALAPRDEDEPVDLARDYGEETVSTVEQTTEYPGPDGDAVEQADEADSQLNTP
ncbi:MAG: transcription antitermination factor NusB [Actinomycetaceae bacterium]|nr:transcription antitermination factor NusB [Actinomycetaceae bacterium]